MWSRQQQHNDRYPKPPILRSPYRSHEHGQLLHSLRTHYGHVVNTLLTTILRLTLSYGQAHATMRSMEGEVADARRGREDIERDIRADYEVMREELEREVRDAKEAAAAEVTKAHEQVERLTDSLRTLNAVFKKMRGEDDILKVGGGCFLDRERGTEGGGARRFQHAVASRRRWLTCGRRPHGLNASWRSGRGSWRRCSR